MRELQRDPGSHLCAAVEGWSWVPAPGELLLTSLLEGYVNTHRDEKQQPVSLPRPWDAADEGDDVTEEQRQTLIEDFQRRSAMRDL